METIEGVKWDILKQLAKQSLSPKQLSEKLGSTIANMSYQLKLLEAYGYVKSERVDKGKGSRKKSKNRVIYTLVKNQTIITQIQPNEVSKTELKQTPINNYILKIMLTTAKENINVLMKLYLNHEDIFNSIDALFYIKDEKDEIHLLVITENIDNFRKKHSKIEIDKEKIVFWSHTYKEFLEGLDRKEQYFIDQIKKSTLLYEKKPEYGIGLMVEK